MFTQFRASHFSVLALIMVAGCGGSAGQHSQVSALPEPNQADICQTNSMAIATSCTPGQKIVFLPEQFGNAQLPVFFAAANCDLRYSVVLTNGAVTCIFKPIKPIEESKPASAPASQSQGK